MNATRLGQRSRDVLRAATTTIVPEAAGLDEAGWRDFHELVDRSLRQRPPALQRRLRIFLLLLDWSPLLRYGRRFTKLDPPGRTRILTYLEAHPLRLLRVGFWGLRALVLMGYYGRAAAAEAIGYRPHPQGWDALER